MYQSQGEVREKLDEILTKLEGIDKRVYGSDCRVAAEFERAHDQGKFISLALRFVVTEVIVCRLLLRDYVHIFYRALIQQLKKPVTELEQNFEKRVGRFRVVAEATLDELSELSVERLHEMAGSGGTIED
jgi:hypothetical protein